MVRPLTSDPGLRSVPGKKLEDLQWLVRGENLLVNGPIGPSKNLLDVPSGKQAVPAEHRVVFIEESVMNGRLDVALPHFLGFGVKLGEHGTDRLSRRPDRHSDCRRQTRSR